MAECGTNEFLKHLPYNDTTSKKDGEKMLRIDSNIIWTIINLIIFFILMRAVLFKPIAKIIKEREELIKNQFEQAQKTEDEANELKAKYEEAVKTSMEIIRNARNRATQMLQESIDQTQQRTLKIIKDTQDEAERQREKLIKDAKGEIAALAVAAATKIIAESSNEKMDQDIYYKYLDKVGESSDVGGS